MKLYRILPGQDDETFCKRVCEKLINGWELYGSPTLTFNEANVIAGLGLPKEDEGTILTR